MSRHFCLLPEPVDPIDAQDALVRLAYYATHAFARGERLHTTQVQIVREALNAPLPARFDPAVAPLLKQMARAVTETVPEGDVRTVCWRMGETGYSKFDKLSGSSNQYFVDDWADPHAGPEWVRLARDAAGSHPDLPDWPASWTAKNEHVALLGPGPGLRHAQDDPSRRTICVASALPAVRDTLRIDAVVFTDSLTLLSPSRFAQENTERLEAAACRGAWLITHDQLASILWSRLSAQAQQKLVSVPIEEKADWPVQPSDTGNVLTTLALPVAGSRASRLSLYGFDGSLDQQVGQSAWHHHTSGRDRMLVEMRLLHPLSGTSETYVDVHRHRVIGMLGALSTAGLAIDVAAPDGRLIKWTPCASDPPLALPPQFAPFSTAYAISAAIDRHPTIGAAIAGTGFGVAAAFLRYSAPAAMTDILICILIGLLAGAGVLCWLNLRRRQARMLDEVHRNLTRQFTEVNEFLNSRIDALEHDASCERSPGDRP